jgi:hypothetical protein
MPIAVTCCPYQGRAHLSDSMTIEPRRRFSVLVHTLPGESVHFDIFFEMDELLFSLKTEQPPGDDFYASRQFDHRKKYLDYEGNLSGDRGAVKLWDQGSMRGEVNLDGEFTVELYGRRLKGFYCIQKLDDCHRVFRVQSP